MDHPAALTPAALLKNGFRGSPVVGRYPGWWTDAQRLPGAGHQWLV